MPPARRSWSIASIEIELKGCVRLGNAPNPLALSRPEPPSRALNCTKPLVLISTVSIVCPK